MTGYTSILTTIYKTFKENLFLSIKKCPNLVGKKKKKERVKLPKRKNGGKKRKICHWHENGKATITCLFERKSRHLIVQAYSKSVFKSARKFRKGIKFLFLKHPPIV